MFLYLKSLDPSIKKEAFEYLVGINENNISAFISTKNAKESIFYIDIILEKSDFDKEIIINFVQELVAEKNPIIYSDEFINMIIKNDAIFSAVIQAGIEKKNAKLIKILKGECDLEERFEFDDKQLQMLRYLLRSKSPDMITEHAVNLESIESFEYEQGLLLAAELYDRKNLEYLGKGSDSDLVVLKNHGEFFVLAQSLKEDTQQLHRFMMTGQHWFSGEFRFDKDENMILVISDSKGGHDPFPTTVEFINAFLEEFPNSKIIINDTKTQNDYINCKAFAFDNARRMMQSQFYSTRSESFIEYAEANAKKTKPEDFSEEYGENNLHEKIYFYSMPASMLVSAQSTSLHQRELSGDKGNQVINKKGQTASQVAPLSYRFDIEKNKDVNKRVEEKTQKWARHCIAFMDKHSDIKLKEKLAAHSVDGYISRHRLGSEKHHKLELR